jgi:hypothetical protein
MSGSNQPSTRIAVANHRRHCGLASEAATRLLVEFNAQTASVARRDADVPAPRAWRGRRRGDWHRIKRSLRRTWRAVRGPAAAIAVGVVAPMLLAPLALGATGTAVAPGGLAGLAGAAAAGVRSERQLLVSGVRGSLLALFADCIGTAVRPRTWKRL